MEATLEPAILYKTIDPQARQDAWMRPASDFLAQGRPGVPRFSVVHQPSSRALRASVLSRWMGTSLQDLVLSEYGTASRFYHAKWHIFDLFEKAQAWGVNLTIEQALAVLLHDVVYVPGAPSGQNETESVLWTRAFQSRHRLDRAVNWDLVAEIIEDTATHVPRCSESTPVMALDLSSLAGDSLEFSVANELVWLENRHLLQGCENPRQEFDMRRLQFLEDLLKKGPIFTGQFAHLEPIARANVVALRSAWDEKYASDGAYYANGPSHAV